jgi:hypothetical protein
MEQISKRTWIVRSSTFARLILMSPTITNPLSRTRSRISTSPYVREGETRSANQYSPLVPDSLLTQTSEWTQVYLQVFVLEAENALHFLHSIVQAEQRYAQAFDFRISQVTPFHPADCLML